MKYNSDSHAFEVPKDIDYDNEVDTEWLKTLPQWQRDIVQAVHYVMTPTKITKWKCCLPHRHEEWGPNEDWASLTLDNKSDFACWSCQMTKIGCDRFNTHKMCPQCEILDEYVEDRPTKINNPYSIKSYGFNPGYFNDQ